MRICPGITTTFVRELRLSLSGNYDPTVRLRWQFAKMARTASFDAAFCHFCHTYFASFVPDIVDFPRYPPLNRHNTFRNLLCAEP